MTGVQTCALPICQQPAEQSVARIGRQIRTENALAEVEDVFTVAQAITRTILPNFKDAAAHEELVTNVMRLIGHEVLRKTFKKSDPAGRNDAARLLLKHSDQNLNQKRFDLLALKFMRETEALKTKEEQVRKANPGHRGVPPEVLEQIHKELRLL